MFDATPNWTKESEHLDFDYFMISRRTIDEIGRFDKNLQYAYGETPGQPGIWPAIADYVKTHPEWELWQNFEHNNGLTVLARH